jgi:putative N6-adenine-specific DNA methylase
MNKILITTNLYMAPMLRMELERMGYPILKEMSHFVETQGTMHDAMRLNKSLFTAHRVMYHIADFKADTPDELHEKLAVLPWHQWIDVDGYFRVDSSVRHQTITDSRYANLRVKDAIVDRMKEEYGRRPNSGNERTGAAVFLFWNDQEGSIFLDTTGEPLSKRGYRVKKVAAPMQETLAAAVVLQTGWDPSAPLVNPMCGTGTIAIEAAMMATRRLPVLLRSTYAYQFLKGYDAEADAALTEEIRQGVLPSDGITIWASDNDPAAIRAALVNAEYAGVERVIEFEVADFRESIVPKCEGGGVAILNAEYGEQLGEINSLKPIYNDIGKWLKQQCTGYTGYLFTGNPELVKAVGLKPEEKTPFMNAKIECRLLKYTIFPPKKDVVPTEADH